MVFTFQTQGSAQRRHRALHGCLPSELQEEKVGDFALKPLLPAPPAFLTKAEEHPTSSWGDRHFLVSELGVWSNNLLAERYSMQIRDS